MDITGRQKGSSQSTLDLLRRLLITAQAETKLRENPDLNHEYLPIAGLPEFTQPAQKLLLGEDSAAIKEKRVRTLFEWLLSSVSDGLSGNDDTDNLRYWRCPSGRSLPRQILQTLLQQVRLHLQSDMGEPQPNLLKRSRTHQDLPLLLRQDQGSRL